MSSLFFDTSALIKRYVLEIGSQWVNTQVIPASGNTIFISGLTLVEVTAGLARRQRDLNLSNHDFLMQRNRFMLHTLHQYQMIFLEKSRLKNARNLVVKHLLRTLDAIQLSCAMSIMPTANIRPQFISADNRLLNIAAQEGFTTDNPNHHP